MADIGASDVTYTVLKRRRYRSRNHFLVRLAFGDGALTVPANGIPLTKAKLGCPNDVESLVVVDKGTSGYIFQYDQSAEKLVVMQSAAAGTHTHTTPAHTHDILVKGGQAAAGTAALAHYATDILGKEAATDATIAGSDAATKGGVVSSGSGTSGAGGAISAAALAEASAVAIAAQTIEVEVIGW